MKAGSKPEIKERGAQEEKETQKWKTTERTGTRNMEIRLRLHVATPKRQGLDWPGAHSHDTIWRRTNDETAAETRLKSKQNPCGKTCRNMKRAAVCTERS